MSILGPLVAWTILLSPLAAAAIVIRSAVTGRRVQGELLLAIFAAFFGGLFWMFAATGYALQTGYSWAAWLPWVFTAAVVCGAAALARLNLVEWLILVAALSLFRVLPYESKVKVESGAQRPGLGER